MPTTDRVRVVLPGTLWDEVVDSIGQDAKRIDPAVNLTRWGTAWTWARAGWGHRATAHVPRPVAEWIAHYLESRAGVDGTGMDPEDRGEARTQAQRAARAAAALRRQLA